MTGVDAGGGVPAAGTNGTSAPGPAAVTQRSPGLLVSLVVAASDNGVIGRDSGMPWHLPDDLRHFRALTLGKPVLMGRRTFEAIGRPLPGRTNLVLSRTPGWSAPGVSVVYSLEQALAAAVRAAAPELVVAGGEQVYRLALPRARRVHLTRIHVVLAGDAVFPELPSGQWREVVRSEHPADERHAYAMSFLTLERV